MTKGKAPFPKELKSKMRFRDNNGRVWQLSRSIVWACDEVVSGGGEVNRLVNVEQLRLMSYDEEHEFNKEMESLIDGRDSN